MKNSVWFSSRRRRPSGAVGSTPRAQTSFVRIVVLVCAALVTSCALPVSRAPTPPRRVVPPPETAAPSDTSVAVDPERARELRRAPTIITGTGKLLAPSTPPADAPPASGDGYQLSFVDADIASVVSSVLGDGLGVPFVVDPQVKGTMSLQATRPLSRDEVLAALEGALRIQGAALVNVRGVYNVVPIKDAPRRLTSLRGADGAGRSGYAIQIVPLQFVSAQDLEKVLQPFAPEGGILRVDEARNLLLLAGTAQEIATMLEVVRTFDVDWLAGMSFGLFPIEYVDAKTIAGELSEVFADPKSPIAGVVRFVPIDRLNSLMVVTSQPRYLQDVQGWIQRLDVGAGTQGQRIYVYDVQNAKADDLANSLNRILSLSGDTGAGEGAGAARPVGSADGAQGASASSALRSGGASQGGMSPNAGSSQTSALETGTVKIVPNQENNSLLIRASPSEFGVIEAALKRLDVQPIQVLIEASLAEVTLTDDLRYGLQWAYQGGDGPATLSESGGGTINQQFPGFSYLFTGRTDIRAVLNAIESLTNVRVLSSPKLLVLNNREAQLQIGDQVPITVQSAVGTGGQNAPIVNSVQFRDTGVILRVTPRVNKSGLVTLDVAQEVSDVVPTTTSGIDSPTIQQRKISSTVAVRDGETIALGGLIRENKSKSGSGLPLLRRIPLLGDLFGSTTRAGRRTELIVLMTPRVIRSSSESNALMEDLRQQFRGLQRVLPEWRKVKDLHPRDASPNKELPQSKPVTAPPVAALPNTGGVPTKP